MKVNALRFLPCFASSMRCRKPGLGMSLLLLAVILCSSCSHTADTLFTSIPSSQSNITFNNHIEEDTSFNILTYEYLYNGGGVATGDLNGDGLPDVVLTGNMVQDKVYLNEGNFQFKDVTSAVHFTKRIRWKTGVVMADVNGDGLLDIYVCYSGPGADADRSNELYINNGVKNGVPTFTESAKVYGLDAPGTYSTTAAFFDMDNDGDLDMFLVNHADMFYNPFYNTDQLRATRHPKFGNRLYRNDNGVFTDISEAAGIAGSGLNFGLSVATSDINGDGWTDLYVTNDYDERDFLYLNNHDGTFREVLDKAANHISEFAMGSDIADYNNDAKPDVMVLDMLPEDNHRQKLLKGADTYDKYTTRLEHGFHHQQMRNTLQLNNGNDSSGMPLFSEVGQLAGVSNTDWSWSPLFADFDNDGWKDLFISNGIFKDITNLDFVKYTSGYSNHFTGQKGDKVQMWQLIKEMPSTRLSNYFYRNNHDLHFTNVSASWGLDKKAISNGSAYADLDNDGDLDLIINCINDEPAILKNNTIEKKGGQYVRIQLKGAGKNTQGIGAKVYVTTAHNKQMQEQFLTRGFQSSIDPVMHLGVGQDSIVKCIEVHWPGGRISKLDNIKTNTTIIINEATAVADTAGAMPVATPLFADITASSGIHYTHQSSSFVDFKVSPLLPYQLSKIGPALAAGDANGDGLEDVFIGAGAEQDKTLFLQTKEGLFVPAANQPWNAASNSTTADALFFDADADGDLDLYLVSGGADYYLHAKNYQDQLYANDGKGNYQLVENALPKETISGACVRAADIDKDGLPDLFVGGKVMPGRFPEAPQSKVLKNKSTREHILFVNDDAQKDTTLLHPGMVTDAVWIDLNKDGWQDLVVAGMFMPITVFENNNGVLQNKTAAYGLQNTRGWWCRLLAADFDNDGDTDLVVGNMGINTQFKASEKEPLTITYADFNGDEVIDPVLCYFNGGKAYPFFSRDEILEQMPALQKRFGRYKDYADAQLTDMFPGEQLAKAATASIQTLQTVYVSNNGNNQPFTIKPLPLYAQISPANGLIAKDVDNDGKMDLIIGGNFYPLRVQLGPMDAGIGMVLKGNGKGAFTPLPYAQTGLYIPGDVRNIIAIKAGNQDVLMAAKNNGPVQLIQCIKQ